MGQATGKVVTPKEKYAYTIGIRDYTAAESRYQYRSLTNPAQNAFQMTKFFRRHDYNVQSNIKEYSDVAEKRAKSLFADDL